MKEGQKQQIHTTNQASSSPAKTINSSALLNLAEVIAASTYGFKSLVDMYADVSDLQSYTALARVFVAGVQASLGEKAQKDNTSTAELNGAALDQVAANLDNINLPEEVVKEMVSQYERQYRELSEADQHLQKATGIENAFLHSKHNHLAVYRSLKAHALSSDSEIPKTIVKMADAMRAGTKGLNAGIIKLLYHVGYEAGKWVSSDQAQDQATSLQTSGDSPKSVDEHPSNNFSTTQQPTPPNNPDIPQTLANIAKHTASISYLGLYSYQQLSKLSLSAANLATIGAAAALDAVFACLKPEERERLEAIASSEQTPGEASQHASLQPAKPEVISPIETSTQSLDKPSKVEENQVSSYQQTIVNLYTSLTKDCSTAFTTAQKSLGQTRSTLASEHGIKDMLIEKPHKLDDIRELQMKKRILGATPQAMEMVDDNVIASKRAAEAVASKMIYNGVNTGVSCILSGLQNAVENIKSYTRGS